MSKSLVKFIGLTVLFLLLNLSLCSAAETGVTVGKKIPPITLKGLDGNDITVAQNDKVLIINFWATWCPPCRQEMPELNSYYLQNSDKVVFYTINMQEQAKSVNDFLYNNHYSFPTLLDSNGLIGDLFQIQYIPTTIVVDKNGIIQFRKSGAITLSELDSIVQPLL